VGRLDVENTKRVECDSAESQWSRADGPQGRGYNRSFEAARHEGSQRIFAKKQEIAKQ
jgi:hypothetical protein